MREIVLDTETTGLDVKNGDRIIEIGCVEIFNLIPTGNIFQSYINPETEVSKEATEISGLTTKFLMDKPIFKDIVEDFLNFIQDSPLIIHNASFDMEFINNELNILSKSMIELSRSIDTLTMAKTKYPGMPANLDALCKRFQIDNSKRIKHGALEDAKLLAQVYLNLKGGRQFLFPFEEYQTGNIIGSSEENKSVKYHYPPRTWMASSEEIQEHLIILKKINNSN